jgi:hypothetical protein
VKFNCGPILVGKIVTGVGKSLESGTHSRE